MCFKELNNISLLKVINGNTRERCAIYSKLKIKSAKWRHSRGSSVFVVDFEQLNVIRHSVMKKKGKLCTRGLKNTLLKWLWCGLFM